MPSLWKLLAFLFGKVWTLLYDFGVQFSDDNLNDQVF